MDDHKEVEELEGKLKDALAKLTRLGVHVGHARTVKEFSSDQRKAALAIEARPYLTKSEGVAASEMLARSSPGYTTKIEALETDFEDAETTLAEWQVTMIKIDSYRSMLAMLRETMHAGIAGGGF